MNRWLVLGPAFLAALALVVFSDPPPQAVDVPEPVKVVRAASPAVPERQTQGDARHDAPLQLIDRALLYPAQRASETHRDLFAGREWISAAVAPQEAAPGPAVPDFPFRYAGKKRDTKGWEVFLTRGEETLIVKEGDVIEPGYRVAKIDPPEMNIMYLPLEHTHVVVIGEGE